MTSASSDDAAVTMSTSLYRKHRPQTFGEISGQRHILTTLQHQLELDRVAHAYLFAGPRGTGKTTTSRILAKAVNCRQRKSGTAEPCNACPACISITAGNALDVLEIDAASHTGVDHVREHIIGSTRVATTSLRSRVFIIDEVHMLSIAAFNALLKTLEEPPPNVLFILATTEVGKLPATIVSRCQRFDFKKISAADICQRLGLIAVREKRNVENGVLEQIAANAEGSVRDAESLLEQVFALTEDSITLDQARLVIPYTDVAAVIEFVASLAARRTAPALEQINRLGADGVDLQHFAAEVTEWLRRFLLLKSGAHMPEMTAGLTEAQHKQLLTIAEQCAVPTLIAVLNVWVARSLELKYASIPQLPLELAVVEICLPGVTDAPTAGAVPASRTPPPAVAAPKASAAPGPAGGSSPTAPAAGIKPAAKAKASRASAGKPPSARPSAAPTAATGGVTMEHIQQQWPEILARMKTQNYSLFSLLRVMRPMQLQGNVLRIGVPYDFHLERIAEMKNRVILERVFSEVIGSPISVAGVVMMEAGKPGYVAEDNQLQSLLENFGGKIVE